MTIVEEGYVYDEEIHFTVLKISHFFSGDGFSAYDSKGQLVFRVDSYGHDAAETAELVLMDADGRCLLTVRRKRWEGFVGERTERKKPLFSVHRSSIIGRSSFAVEVYGNPSVDYHIEGSFGCRNCKILNEENEAVAEIRRKVDASTNVVLGKDVFLLSLKPGFDGAFAMGLVLVLDRIHGDEEEEVGENYSRVGVEPIISPRFCSFVCDFTQYYFLR